MPKISDLGMIDHNNSTTTLLGSGAAFTGRASDATPFSTITVFAYSDVVSAADGFSIEFSTDGTNWDRAKITTLTAGVSQIHSLAVVTQYYRVVITNGTSAQSEFRVQSICHVNKPRDITSGTEQVIQKYDDVTLVRSVSDTTFDRNVGRIGYESVHTFRGVAAGIGTTFVSNWEYFGTADFVFPTTAETIRIRAGGNAADDNDGGAGARTVVVTGLDENFEEISDTLTLEGADVSSPTTNTYIRVNSMTVATTGAYGVANTGNIILENSSTNAVLGYIPATVGIMHAGRFTVPAGKTMYITKEVHTVSVGNTATINIYTREDASVVAAPFKPAILEEEVIDFEGTFIDPHDSYLVLTEKSDIYIEAAKVSGGGTASVSSEVDFILVSN